MPGGKLKDLVRTAAVVSFAILCAGSMTNVPVSAGHAKRPYSAEVYSLKAPLTANTTPIGDLIVCAALTDSTQAPRMIEVEVTMPDSGQTLNFKAPVKPRGKGKVVFAFDDDGWGNAGRGTLTQIGRNSAKLDLEHTGSTPDANKNILRNYGSFTLTRKPCD